MFESRMIDGPLVTTFNTAFNCRALLFDSTACWWIQLLAWSGSGAAWPPNMALFEAATVLEVAHGWRTQIRCA